MIATEEIKQQAKLYAPNDIGIQGAFEVGADWAERMTLTRLRERINHEELIEKRKKTLMAWSELNDAAFREANLLGYDQAIKDIFNILQIN